MLFLQTLPTLFSKGHRQQVSFARVLDVGAIRWNTKLTITTSYRKAIAVDKPLFTIAVVAIRCDIKKTFFHLFVTLSHV